MARCVEGCAGSLSRVRQQTCALKPRYLAPQPCATDSHSCPCTWRKVVGSGGHGRLSRRAAGDCTGHV
eukprot:364875-Chlamydomonas_euryale.AAC.8